MLLGGILLLQFISELPCLPVIKALPNLERQRLELIEKEIQTNERSSFLEELEFAQRLKNDGYQVLKIHYNFKDPQTGADIGEADVLAIDPKGLFVWFELKTALAVDASSKKTNPRRFVQLDRLQKIARGESKIRILVDRVYLASMRPISQVTLNYLWKEYPELIPFSSSKDKSRALEKSQAAN